MYAVPAKSDTQQARGGKKWLQNDAVFHRNPCDVDSAFGIWGLEGKMDQMETMGNTTFIWHNSPPETRYNTLFSPVSGTTNTSKTKCLQLAQQV